MTGGELAARIKSKLDLAHLAICSEKFGTLVWHKFFDVDRFLSVQAEHALRLSALIPPFSRCLDVGAGFGYCALALQELGHDVIAHENDYAAIREISKAIPVPWHFEPIRRCEGLALSGTPFELIVCHGVIPIRDSVGWWEWLDYAGIAGDMLQRLAHGGVMEIIVNRGEGGECALVQDRWNSVTPDGVSVAVVDNVIHGRRLLTRGSA